MHLPFRQHHILSILEGYEQQSLPLDLFLKDYFRLNKALGSKDRSYIADTTYALVRWKGLLDFLCNESPDWKQAAFINSSQDFDERGKARSKRSGLNEEDMSKDMPDEEDRSGEAAADRIPDEFMKIAWKQRLEIFLDPSFENSKQRMDIPDHIRLSFPKPLFDAFVSTHGLQKACEICAISNYPAPTTIRVNTMKTTREEMLKRWRGIYDVSPCQISPNGIIFQKRLNFSSMPEYREGLFEVQDEGSQLLAELVKAKPGDLVMDYCSGSGGKTLAFAPKMQNKGQIYLHDIRKHVLLESRIRLRRAGIQNAQVFLAEDENLKKLKKKMDWVLVDAPCSGTGTLRRNPDMKWKFDCSNIPVIQGQQRMIFEKALSFLKPSGHIVYSTCSLLKEENEDQMNHFLKTYDLVLAEDVFESLPLMHGMDGFYGAVFKRK